MKIKRVLVTVVAPLAIVAMGLLGMRTLIASKTPPEKKTPEVIGTLVETQVVNAGRYNIQVHATGTVQPAMVAELIPQVSGKVIKVAPGFVEGGFFKKGALLFEIEAADYRLALEKSRAQVAKAEYDLASMESQARIARLEWERIDLKDKSKPNPLVLYEPQLKNAQAALAAARADLEQRRLDIDRTRVRAPFNCRVRSKSVDPGQFVAAGKTVAVVAGTDAGEIVVPVSLEELQWLQIPRRPGQPGAVAQVRLPVGGRVYSWNGRVHRSLGQVDAASRMARVVVRVDDPYGLKKNDNAQQRGLDLAEGLFVDVTIDGPAVDRVFAIPADTIRQHGTVWVMGPDDRLHIHQVSVLRREKNTVLVTDGLNDRDRLVTTHLSGVAEGMMLRSVDKES